MSQPVIIMTRLNFIILEKNNRYKNHLIQKMIFLGNVFENMGLIKIRTVDCQKDIDIDFAINN